MIPGIDRLISIVLIICGQRILIFPGGFVAQDHALCLIVISKGQLIGSFVQHITFAGFYFFQDIFAQFNIIKRKLSRRIPVPDLSSIRDISLAFRVQHVSGRVHHRRLSDRSGHHQVSCPVDHACVSVRVNDIFRRPQFIDRAFQSRISLYDLALRFCIVFYHTYAAFCPLVCDRSLIIGGCGLRGLIIVALYDSFFGPGPGNLKIIGIFPVRAVILPSCRMSGDQLCQPVLPVAKVTFSGF